MHVYIYMHMHIYIYIYIYIYTCITQRAIAPRYSAHIIAPRCSCVQPSNYKMITAIIMML